jgi:uncharacterized protein (DUF1499 family)
MTDATQTVAWWAQVIALGAIVSGLLLPLGALGTRFGFWNYPFGLMLVASGFVIAVIGVFGAAAGLLATFKGGLGSERLLVLLGLLVCLGVLTVVTAQFNRVRTVPPIHNVSTDVQDPPSFRYVQTLRGSDANPLDYDAAELAPLQQAAYPWLQPMRVDLAPSESFARARQVLEAMGLEVVHAEPRDGRLEAVATSFWFGFKDDLVVRIRPEVGGSVLDLRSVSRVGQSDLGANARRIAEFQYRFHKNGSDSPRP